ncbi:MAG: DUF3987 domain-containing protein [Gammaproteobacteria bacterium]|nr:MAG: DUF3987 domain-containing protein [Gammaproteobacteria bacterium]
MNLFAVLVGETSKARKGSSWGHAKRITSDADPSWGNRIRSGLSSGEGLIWQVRDPIEKQQRTKENGQTCYETVVDDPGVDDKRLLVCESEYASVLKVMRREGNTLSPTIRNAWDSGTLQTLTKNSPAVATGAHISIIGHITKDELLRQLDSTEAGNGFGNRFLWFCVRRSKMLPEGGDLRDEELSALVAELADTLEWAQASGDFELKRDDVARAVWRAVYPTLSEGKTGLLGAMLARSEAQVMRLACLYALLDQANVVRIEHLLAALALWDYVEASAGFIFGDALGDPVADAILSAIRGSEMGMTKTEIHAFLGRHKPKSQVDSAITQLVEKRLARLESEPTSGRAATRIVANSHNSLLSHVGTESQHGHSYLALAKASIPTAHQLPGARRGPSSCTRTDGDTSPDSQTRVDAK